MVGRADQCEVPRLGRAGLSGVWTGPVTGAGVLWSGSQALSPGAPPHTVHHRPRVPSPQHPLPSNAPWSTPAVPTARVCWRRASRADGRSQLVSVPGLRQPAGMASWPLKRRPLLGRSGEGTPAKTGCGAGSRLAMGEHSAEEVRLGCIVFPFQSDSTLVWRRRSRPSYLFSVAAHGI